MRLPVYGEKDMEGIESNFTLSVVYGGLLQIYNHTSRTDVAVSGGRGWLGRDRGKRMEIGFMFIFKYIVLYF
ncbi:hypothetical protein HanIR_Chr04g0166231 [Helianthus annuus]|nr:hypothetical protein HanIR_Chr04g0166231 [Helianthus annuus]